MPSSGLFLYLYFIATTRFEASLFSKQVTASQQAQLDAVRIGMHRNDLELFAE